MWTYSKAILLLLLLAPVGNAAVYYASPAGSNTSPYDTWAKAANLPSTAVTAGNTDTGGDGPHTMYIAPGAYASQLLLTDADWAGGTIIGTAAHGSTAPAVKGQIVITKSAGYGCSVGVADVTLQNIGLANVPGTGAFSALYYTGTGLVGTNLSMWDTGGQCFYSNGGIGFLITNSRMAGAAGANGILVAGAGDGTFNYCVMTCGLRKTLGTAVAITNTGTGTLTLNNCVVTGGNGGVLNSGTGTTTANNCFVSSTGTQATIEQTAGTVNLTNNLFIAGRGALHKLLAGTIATDVGNLADVNPRFVRRLYNSGIIIPTVDDTANLAYARLLEAKLAARGMQGSFNVSAKDAAANAVELQDMFDDGVMSVHAHGYSHSDLSLTGNIYSITKVGATINVDRGNDQIVVNPGGTVTGFKAKTLSAIQTELQGFGCTIGTLRTQLNSGSLGEIIADSAGAQASPYTAQLLIDATAATGYFKVEIADAKSVLESVITGYTGKGFVEPYGASSADSIAAVQASGWLGCRPGDGAGQTLLSLSVYGGSYMGCTGSLTYDDPEPSVIQARTRSLCEYVADKGILLFLLSHTATECTIDQWEIILDIIAEYSEISVLSHDATLDLIRDGGLWSTADQITYTRTFTDIGDYRLLAGSPCINAGVDVGLTTDYAGTAVPQGALPDMGAYEYLLPTAATTPSPADDAVDVAVDASLSWAEVATATSYDVYLDDTLVSNDQAGTSYNPTDFIPYSNHTWRVDTNNAAGTTTGTEWSFTTEILGGVFSASDISSKDSKNGGK